MTETRFVTLELLCYGGNNDCSLSSVSHLSPIVIDGWHLRPSRVAELNLPNLWSGWIVISASVLVEREKKNLQWLQGSSSPERMLENFLARSLWYNDLIKEQASELQMNILPQEGDTFIDDLCNMILKTIDG